MKDFSKQIEDLRKEITEAIIVLLRRHGLKELEFPESDTVPNAPDAVYVIFFDDDGDPVNFLSVVYASITEARILP